MSEEMNVNLEMEDFDANEPEVEAGEAPQELSLEELDEATGGVRNSRNDAIHNLKNYVWKPVHNAKGGRLYFRRNPKRAKMDIFVPNGQFIYVHKTYVEDGFYLAYDPGTKLYGYVDKRCVG